jgi:D-amino peptidase
MKLYILADMEGISGIRRQEQVQRDQPDYAGGCELMMQEMNVAISAAFDAGATEVVACDTHGGGGQVRIDKMDSRAVYEQPACGAMMPALDESFGGVVLLGHHARAGTLNGFLDHTMSSASWFEFRINGDPVGEIGIEAAYAGHFGVPVIAVTGDEATAAEAKALLGDVECAVVKTGLGRNHARCLPLPDAHERVRKAVSDAASAAERFQPWTPSLPATLELTVYRSDMADGYATRERVQRLDARTLRTRIDMLRDIRAIF